MEFRSFEQLVETVKSKPKRKRMAVAAANDTHTLEAVFHAAVETILEEQGMDFSGIDIYDCPDPAEAASMAVRLVREGKADFIMKGSLDTKVMLKAVVDREKGLGSGRTMSHFCIIEIPGYHKLAVITDSGMLTHPTLEQKKDIIINAVEAMHAMGYECPKAAVLSCVEKVNSKMPETMDGQTLQEMNQIGEISGCIVEGPISYDCAMSREIAALKGYESRISGDVDILVTPDINSGNILGKALTVSCGSRMAGFIVGARCPVVVTSRGSSAEEKYLSVAVCAALGPIGSR